MASTRRTRSDRVRFTGTRYTGAYGTQRIGTNSKADAIYVVGVPEINDGERTVVAYLYRNGGHHWLVRHGSAFPAALYGTDWTPFVGVKADAVRQTVQCIIEDVRHRAAAGESR